MMKKRFLNVLSALMLVAVAAAMLTGCSMFTGSSSGTTASSGNDIAAKLQTINKTVVNGIVLAYQSGGNQLAYQQIDKAVTDGKITPEQAAQLKAAADKGIAALQASVNTQTAAVAAPVASATATTASPPAVAVTPPAATVTATP